MRYYADSSFLVSCCLLDGSTGKARTYLTSNSVSFPFTVLHDLEVTNAFRLGIFRGLFSKADATAASANLEQDIISGRLIRTSVNWPGTFRTATRLSDQHSAIFGTRSLDILHVAAAKALQPVEFVSLDLRQRALAVAVGLKVAP